MTSSDFTKRDLIEKFHVPQEKIKVVYAAHEDRFRPAEDVKVRSLIRARISGGEEYLLHFSTGDPRDNTSTVLAAFEKARLQLAFGVKLIIVGGRWSTNGDGIPSGFRASDSVIWRPFLPDQELVELFQGASLYVDPSFYEGFGFQPLEAMACGAPVIASNVTAVPEIVGEAGLLVDPKDSDTLAETMVKVLKNRSLQNEMREKGFKQAARFKWNQTAEQVFEIFEEVLRKVKSHAHSKR
ncbi:MAG: glycosyltransferase family 4 protein [Candidatus Omnitrophica bacterium]|nr:glycosyltransferase family 4 protein [Candidatus Omnitrophota bacterium]